MRAISAMLMAVVAVAAADKWPDYPKKGWEAIIYKTLPGLKAVRDTALAGGRGRDSNETNAKHPLMSCGVCLRAP